MDVLFGFLYLVSYLVSNLWMSYLVSLFGFYWVKFVDVLFGLGFSGLNLWMSYLVWFGCPIWFGLSGLNLWMSYLVLSIWFLVWFIWVKFVDVLFGLPVTTLQKR